MKAVRYYILRRKEKTRDADYSGLRYYSAFEERVKEAYAMGYQDGIYARSLMLGGKDLYHEGYEVGYQDGYNDAGGDD